MLAPAQQSLNIICCSSNIGNTQIHSKDLAAWLPVNGRVVGDDRGGQYDIIAVGMQEVGLSFSFLSLFPILFFTDNFLLGGCAETFFSFILLSKVKL